MLSSQHNVHNSTKLFLFYTHLRLFKRGTALFRITPLENFFGIEVKLWKAKIWRMVEAQKIYTPIAKFLFSICYISLLLYVIYNFQNCWNQYWSLAILLNKRGPNFPAIQCERPQLTTMGKSMNTYDLPNTASRAVPTYPSRRARLLAYAIPLTVIGNGHRSAFFSCVCNCYLSFRSFLLSFYALHSGQAVRGADNKNQKRTFCIGGADNSSSSSK